MTYQSATISNNQSTLPQLPGWVTSGRVETLETVAFRSGAALTVLDQLIGDPRHGVPGKLLANRLALTAATATSKLEGRLAKEADIRDAYHLTPLGEARGPDGDLLAHWREAARSKLTGRDWHAGLVGPEFEMDVDGWLQSAANHSQSQGPLTGCVAVMRFVLRADDRAERVACLMSDIVLARFMNWSSVLPISAQHLTKAMLRDLAAEGQGTELAVQQRLLRSVEDTTRLARDLARRAEALRTVAPKLRAKGSDPAVALFLSEDAVAPSTMLSPMIQGTSFPMTDRAARRFCDRLVELGVARELTGRPTFRLYGIAL
ncbi:DUF1403 family protein [Sulfitobacter pacificus]|uniref:DUF1403 family protein n=1 Tax=Sulfitobacter pacificus TaxID=1499314 RepID=A0ABQ5VQ02_9RHOB|nr:DUF1403 family protein [Sulfitobacter pacificus]GLQ29297.1 hypothetical protein GCM10007927_41010 [Sulfitobacter pacificus]